MVCSRRRGETWDICYGHWKNGQLEPRLLAKNSHRQYERVLGTLCATNKHSVLPEGINAKRVRPCEMSLLPGHLSMVKIGMRLLAEEVSMFSSGSRGACLLERKIHCRPVRGSEAAPWRIGGDESSAFAHSWRQPASRGYTDSAGTSSIMEHWNA